jgi:DNA-binding NarL/FixJ family response regulator
MGDTAQYGSVSSAAWPATDRRRPILNEVSPVDTGICSSQARGTPAGRQRPVATMLIGPNALFLEGLKHILAKTGFDVVALGSTAEELDLSSARQHHALLFILDAARDTQMTIHQIELFKQQRPDAFITTLIDPNRMTDIALLFQAGANACFAKEVSTSVFLKSLELVMMGETLLPSSILSSICGRAEMPVWAAPANSPTARLSAQEERILRHLVEGHPNKAIARELGIADATVKVHVKAILKKIGAQNRTQAAIWATRNAAFDRTNRESPPRPSVPADERPLLAASPATGGECPVAVPVAGNEALEGEKEEAPAAAAGEYAQEVTSRATVTRQTSALRSARRIAEDEERHGAMVAKINQLRELREARDMQARPSGEGLRGMKGSVALLGSG